MKIDKLKILTRALSILLFATGLLTMLFFFPVPGAGFDLMTGFFYFLIGLVLIIISVGLFLFKPIARKFALIFSTGFLLFFLYETITLIQTDHTGQGFIGLLLISPVAMVCFLTVLVLIAPSVRNFFNIHVE